MAGNNLLVPGVLVVLGGGIVVATMLWLGGREAQSVTARSEAGSQVLVAQSGGVRPADVDPAGRVDLDPRAGDEPPQLPAFRPEGADAALEEEARRRAAPPPEPPEPPPPLTEEEVAANAAHMKLREQVARDVGKQLGEQQSALRKACWKNTGGASSAEYSVNASFDASGKLMAMGISDVRGPDSAATAGVGQCLRGQAIPLNIEAPGQGVTVDVPLRLP